MSENEREQLLADCVEDYHRRRALGQSPAAEDYRDRLGDHHEEFLEILAAEEALDQAVRLTPDQPFPRPFGEYTLIAELGRGAMGVVFEAVHRPLGRKVALKVLRTGFDTEALALQRFQQEARACAQVAHENIIEIFEAGEVDGRPFYAMPLLEGRTLKDLLRDDELPDPKTLCRGLAGIADALAALHEAGIVHRDVKPGNILIRPDGRMILCDFGLARTATSQTLTQTGQALGTPLYMSPEQLLGRREEIDGRTDIYGLGVTLYEVLAKRAPFRAEDITTLMQMILSERPKPLREIAPTAPSECASIALQAMETRKRDRYQTAGALRDDLLAYAEDRPVSARPVSPLRRTLRRLRGRLLMAAAALVVLTGGFFWYVNRPATLEVDCFPSARVEINGEDTGRKTPFEVELPHGDYVVVFREDGFDERTEHVTLEAGERSRIKTFVVAGDAEDPDVQARLAKHLEVALVRFERTERVRGGGLMRMGGGPPVQILYPQGDLRVEDLRTYRVDLLDVDYEPAGAIVFRRGEEVLHEVAYDPENIVTEAAVPEAVRAALRAGDVVTWGYEPRLGSPATAEFRVISSEAEASIARRLAAIETRLEGQPETLLAHFRAQVLLDADLPQAALLEARAAIEQRENSARSWAALREALRRMSIERSRLGREVQGRLDRFGQEALKDVLVPR